MRYLDYSDFKYYLGETLEFCQTIEHDVKWMYALMLNGDKKENFNNISLWPLGKTVIELEKLDYSDNKPFLSRKDYSTLKKISFERNYLCHNIYRTFLYGIEDWEHSVAYVDACTRLMDFHDKLKILRELVQEVRIKVVEMYKR